MERRSLALLALLAGATFAARLGLLLRTGDPLGADGFYYVVQAEHFAATGRPKVADASWVLPLLAAPHAIGLPAVAGVAVAAAALAGASVAAAFAAGRTISARAGWALALATAASPTLGQLSADFPKNLGAIPALWGVLAAARAGWTRSAFALALLAATAHRVGAALVLLGAIGGLGGLALRRAPVSPRALVGGVAVATVFAALASALPGLLHPADLERVTGQLRATSWPPPPFGYLALRAFHPLQAVEVVVLPWTGVAAGLAALRDPALRPTAGALLLPLAVCLFPGWRQDALDLGYRLALLAPFVALPLLALGVPPIPLPPWSAALWLPAGAVAPDPDHAPPWDVCRRWLSRIPEPLPELLIVRSEASFLYTHETGRGAMSWAPEPELDRTRIGRVAWGIRDGEWAAFSDGSAVRLDRDHVFLREDAWEAFVARAREAGDDELLERLADRRNPSRLRPRYLRR